MLTEKYKMIKIIDGWRMKGFIVDAWFGCRLLIQTISLIITYKW